MINTIKYGFVTLAILSCILTGCSSADSGLYRINAQEASGEAKRSVLDGADENDQPTLSEGSGGNDPSGKTQGADQNASVSSQAETKEGGADADMADSGNSVPGADSDLNPQIFVHVCGAVNSPGVYSFENGDRIFNAIEEAGGFTEDADRDYINLAMALADGMQINVPTGEETKALGKDITDVIVLAQADSGSSTPSEGADSGSSGPSGAVNINTADEKQLMTISGIGQTRAQAIIAYRNEHGSFSSTQDIKNVSGIGDATYEKLKDQITVK